ncbi:MULTISPECIES: DNA-binding protein [Enterococcus]|uniref:DNA-binding protein n=1 Tax=Enterococcus TaxID=1350 RepID=UPI000F50EA19|nr:DNA-binding protein [Enterococcus faecium]MBC9705242.1 DNA-binding protein [Enterococcus sp.]EKO5893596.1 DNA-binding protein [Enterococcus faecium]EME8102144.1 DNA-binding protein [Enterococcus faecium]NTL31218.1 DNA-binding protein [Enterococcus faecium]ROW74389.1 DNA-binding protein [Enterococcus faecium]
MSEKLKTIKELADELSVTKQNIQYHYQRLPKELHLKSSDGSNLINSKAEKIILGKVEKSTKYTTKDIDKEVTGKDAIIQRLISEVEYLKIDKDKMLTTKDQQITSKDKQIEILTSLLDQQQRLALQDKKLLEEYKEEINELKSLMVPVREDEKESVARKSNDIDKIKEEPQKKNKKWWHFGRM